MEEFGHPTLPEPVKRLPWRAISVAALLVVAWIGWIVYSIYSTAPTLDDLQDEAAQYQDLDRIAIQVAAECRIRARRDVYCGLAEQRLDVIFERDAIEAERRFRANQRHTILGARVRAQQAEEAARRR